MELKRFLAVLSFAILTTTSLCWAADEAKPGAELDGVRWNFPSADKLEAKLRKGAVCKSALVKGDPKTTDNFSFTKKFGGEKGKRYKVTLRFRGVVEPMMYKDGKKEGEYFYIGGKPDNSKYNVYKLEISSPKSHYFLNSQKRVGHKIFTVDYTTTIEIDGGATLTISGNGQNGLMIANFSKLMVKGIDTKPYNGQYMQVNVVKVE